MLPSTSEFIKKYGLDAKKSLGQNFILDKNFTDKIAKSALCQGKNDFSDEVILEIGPGPASLTRSILDLNPKKLIVIEKDSRCVEILREIQEFYGREKLEIINDDALLIDEKKILEGEGRIKIISNLPYNIGTILLIKWLKIANQIESMTLMLQKEVAQRISAKVNENHYGRLAIITNHLAKSEILFLANRNIFTPPPKVTSAIVQITPNEKKIFDVEFSKLEKITAKAFNQRRKMIKTSLKGLVFQKDLTQILQDLAIDGNLRPENIDIVKFCQMAANLK